MCDRRGVWTWLPVAFPLDARAFPSWLHDGHISSTSATTLIDPVWHIPSIRKITTVGILGVWHLTPRNVINRSARYMATLIGVASLRVSYCRSRDSHIARLLSIGLITLESGLRVCSGVEKKKMVRQRQSV